jgi:hypothetical protein
MGAWGTGIFDNDTACDWAYLLEESKDLSVVEAALEKVLAVGPGYLEAPDAEEALAAGEVVARLQGNFSEKNSYTGTVDTWVAENNLGVSPGLARKSLAAIDRILSGPSEIVELWKESDEYGAWKACIDNLKSRIRI